MTGSELRQPGTSPDSTGCAATIAVDDFARAIGVTPDDVPSDLRTLITASDLRYRLLSQEERDRVILSIITRLDANGFSKAGKDRRANWERAWAELAEDSARTEYAAEGLVPRYVDANPVVRFQRDYVQPLGPDFEGRFSKVFRTWLFRKYLASPAAIYEFGCGSGFNLLALGRLFPDKSLCGLDWADSSVQLVNAIARRHRLQLTGRSFDFFAPDGSMELEPGSAVLTMCALEQIGADHEAFIQFLLARSPAICVTMEPLYELYEAAHLVDFLAMKYHEQRGYLRGYLPRLRQLESQGRLEILRAQRVCFGNLYHEGYSYVVWRPVAA